MLRGPAPGAGHVPVRMKGRVARATLVAERQPSVVVLTPLRGGPRQEAEQSTVDRFLQPQPVVAAHESAFTLHSFELGLAELQKLTAELEQALGGAEQVSVTTGSCFDLHPLPFFHSPGCICLPKVMHMECLVGACPGIFSGKTCVP